MVNFRFPEQAQFNPVGAFSAGQQVYQQNALANFAREHGPGLAQGDPNAINALAQIDPMRAIEARNVFAGQDAQRMKAQRAEQEYQMKRIKVLGEVMRDVNDPDSYQAAEDFLVRSGVMSREEADKYDYSMLPQIKASLDEVTSKLPTSIQEFNYAKENPDYAAFLDRNRKGGGKGGEFGLTPIYALGEDGRLRAYQLSKEGGVKEITLPEGYDFGPGISKVDAGTGTVLIDNKTGRQVGFIESDIAGAEGAKVRGKAEAEASVAAPGTVAKADQMLVDIDALINDEGLGVATGWGSYVPIDIPEFNAETRSRMGKVQGQVFLQAFESLKGGGQITEVEGQKAEAAMGRLNAAQSQEEYTRALRELRAIVVKARRRAAGKADVDTGGEPAADRYRQLLDEGYPEEDAYRMMVEEGF